MISTDEQNKQKYLNACLIGDIDTVTDMIKTENKQFKNYMFLNSCIKNACKGGHIHIFNAIYEYRDILNVEETNLSVIFQNACSSGNTELINRIMEIYTFGDKFHMSTNLFLYHGLIGACEGGHLDIFKLYVGDVGMVSNKNNYFDLLYNACRSGNINLVRYIMNCDINGNITTSNNSHWNLLQYWNNCLRHACLSNIINVEIINLTISKGANDWDGSLYFACKTGKTGKTDKTGDVSYLEIIEFFISKGATNLDKCLYEACKNNNMDIVEILINRGANNWDEGMFGACVGGFMDIVKFMINKGAANWNEGLKAACEGGCMDIVNFMITKGANDWNGGLNGAIIGHHIEIVYFMLSKGADDYYSCWYHACYNGELELVKMLINNKVNSQQNFNEGFMYACASGHMDVVRLILRYGVTNYKNSLVINFTCNDDINNLIISKYNICIDNFSEYNVDLYGLRNTTNFKLYSLYCAYCKSVRLTPDMKHYNKLYQDHPPYVLFVGSVWCRIKNSMNNNNNKCHVHKLPAELFVLLGRYW